MSKPMWAFLIVFICLALIVAWKFGGLGPDQFVYLGKMIAGWLAWTCAVAVIYYVLEKLLPSVLTPPLVEDPGAPK